MIVANTNSLNAYYLLDVYYFVDSKWFYPINGNIQNTQ